MRLPARLGLRLLAVALLGLAGAVAWTVWEARASLRGEAAISAERVAALYARQPGLGSAGLAGMPVPAAQATPAVLTLLPGICAAIHLRAEEPRRFCGDWDGLSEAPGWFRTLLGGTADPVPTRRDIVYRERVIGTVSAWPDPTAAAGRIWRQVRIVGGLALALAAATALLGWLAAARLVAPVGRIVRGLEGLDRGAPPLPRFAVTDLDRIATACNRLADRLARAEAERAALLRRLVRVQEEERQALARDLHDDFGQCLAAIAARAAAIELAAPPDRPDLREDARAVEAAVALMRTSLHGALARLELPDLAETGLVPGLRALIAGWRMPGRTGPALHLDVTGDLSGLPAETSAALYRIEQELLTNALRHGQPSRVFLRLERAETGARTILTVDDDGGGDVARTETAAGRGLVGVRARLGALGGSLSLTGTGSGIRACAVLPAGSR